MNETLRIQKAHRSIRNFKTDPVSDEMLEQIIAAAHQAPSSMNAQEISLVVVRDPARRASIAELAGGQAWIAQAPVFIVVVIDFRKTTVGMKKAGQEQVIHESMEGFGAASVDAGIVLGTLITAAESLGLGIVPIGGVRRNPQEIIDRLNLPRLTFPMVGLCIGHIANNMQQKPRLNINTFRHDERYDSSGYAAAIAAYDDNLLEYWKKIGRPDGLSWSNNLGPFKAVYYPNVRPTAIEQGLLNDK